jgi:hypothetical protein
MRVKKKSPARRALDIALDSAQAHGEQSEPDHEVGDLLELIEALYAEMTYPQRRRALTLYGKGRTWWGPARLEGRVAR